MPLSKLHSTFPYDIRSPQVMLVAGKPNQFGLKKVEQGVTRLQQGKVPKCDTDLIATKYDGTKIF